MDVTISAHDKPAITLALERSVDWSRDAQEIERRFRVAPEGHFVARSPDGRTLGGVSCATYGPAPGRDRGIAWIGGLAVHPDARRRGVGGALMERAIRHAEEKGAAAIGLDATPDAQPMFEKLGFRAVDEVHRWARPEGAERPAPKPFGSAAVYPVSFSELMEVSDYDAPRFGASRARLVAEALADFPERAFLAYDRETGACVGLVLGGERFVGPLTADAPDVAARLLYACEQAGTPPVVNALAGNADAARVLREAGYAPEGCACVRMLRGADALPGRPGDVYATADPALG